MQFAVTADCHFPVQKMPCFTVLMNIQTKRLNPGESLQSPGRAPVNRHYAGTHRGYTGIRPRQSCGKRPGLNRGQPGLHRESIQMFNTSGDEPGVTGKDQAITGLAQETTGTAPGTTGTVPSEHRFTYVT
ncbi:hypothetical protein DPMN_186594 [Dreissena polymorpha]|uniref:Uncharacterized protein n=1 Tax=Dreissena polymorpha TaxID=45954 RepID=A0A9D4DMG1_DREPO|nr:hypothetical protein DPMN_186594 [Dreissena polymorpha]